MNFLQFTVTLKWSHYRPQTLKPNQTSPFNSECNIILIRGKIYLLPFTLFLYLLTFGWFGRCCRGLHIEGANFKLDPRIATLSNTHPNFFISIGIVKRRDFRKGNLHILFKTKLDPFSAETDAVKWVSKCSVNTQGHFGEDITVALMVPKKWAFQSFYLF